MYFRKIICPGYDFKKYSNLPHEVNPILSLEVYLELEKRRETFRPNKAVVSRNTSSSQQFVEECEHIHNKAIFDTVNEALNLIRPYSLSGTPMPWSSQPRILFTKISDPILIMRNMKNIILDWANFCTGTLPKREYLYGDRFDEEYFAETREKKLVNLLAQEIIDGEEQWLHYENEESEVSIDLADMIMEHLVSETAELLIRLEAVQPS